MMIKADLHTHTRFSPDSATPPEKLVARCIRRGLDCIAVTDHNTVKGAMAVKEMSPFTVIVGEEIKTTGGDIIGLFLQEVVPPGLSPQAAAEHVKAQGGLVSIPHPFDRFRGSALRSEALEEVLPLADIVEGFNARNALGSADRRAMALANEHKLAICAVSDAHAAFEVGRTYVLMPEFDGTAQGFLACLRQGNMVTHRSSPLVHVITTCQKLKKRLLRR